MDPLALASAILAHAATLAEGDPARATLAAAASVLLATPAAPAAPVVPLRRVGP